MDLKKKYDLKHLTKKQKLKANKIVKLMGDLKNEGVNTVLIASPNNSLNFYRANDWVENIEHMQGICNETDFRYSPNQDSGLIDAFAF